MRHHHSGHHGHHRLHEALHSFIGRRHRHGHDFGGFAGFEDGEGGRRRGRVFDAAELRLVLLKLLADQPRHGYDLIGAIEEMTAGAYSPSPGLVYPTLTLLSEQEFIREWEGDPKRKSYEATPNGWEELRKNEAKVTELISRLTEMATERKRFDGMPVRRAMMNLRAVLMNKLGSDTEKLHAITAIIDDAAQRIERL